MTDEEGSGDPYPEWLVAENLSEAVWLRLRRFTSPTLCERTIAARAPGHAPDILKKKGQELAFAVRSALGYWRSETSARHEIHLPVAQLDEQRATNAKACRFESCPEGQFNGA